MKIDCFAEGCQIAAYADRPEYKVSLRFDKANLPQELSGDHICEVRSLFQHALEKATKISIVIGGDANEGQGGQEEGS